MERLSTDIAIVGAGMAGASLAAAIAGRASVLLLERESQPGYHATGRSAAFWSESYGGSLVQPLTTASGPWLADRGLLSPRGCLHIAESPDALNELTATLEAGGVAWEPMSGEAVRQRVPGLQAKFDHAVWEPTCQDIDVAGLHAFVLAKARRHRVQLRCHAGLASATRRGDRWQLRLPGAEIDAGLLVNAAGAWAGEVARMAGAAPIPIRPMRRTVIQLVTDPPSSPDLPLVMDATGQFYFKPEAGGRLWLSPHDETPVAPHDVAPEEWDQALAIDRFEQAMSWRVVRRERAWAGLRSFAPDRLPVYGFDVQAEGFFWCAGQGGFGIQTAPAAAALGAALLLREAPPAEYAEIAFSRYAPGRFRP